MWECASAICHASVVPSFTSLSHPPVRPLSTPFLYFIGINQRQIRYCCVFFFPFFWLCIFSVVRDICLSCAPHLNLELVCSIKTAIQRTSGGASQGPEFQFQFKCHDVALIDQRSSCVCDVAVRNPCVALCCGAGSSSCELRLNGMHTGPVDCAVVSRYCLLGWCVCFFCLFLVAPPPVARRRTIYTHL